MLNILVVDDDGATLEKFKEINNVCAGACAIELCDSVAVARQLLDAHDFHIICLDINMEGTDGSADSGLILAQEIKDGVFANDHSDALLLCISSNCDVSNESVKRYYLRYFDLVPGKLNGHKVLHELIVQFKDNPYIIAAHKDSLK